MSTKTTTQVRSYMYDYIINVRTHTRFTYGFGEFYLRFRGIMNL